MQALVLTDYRKLQLTELDRPPLDAEDVLVRVAACGICGSDVHGYDGSTGRRKPPLVMGHEASGVVESVGEAASRSRIGQKVTFDSTLSCGRCDACRQGAINLCTSRRIFGVACDEFSQQGAFAEFVAVPERILHPLPDNLPLEHAAMIEPVAVALHAVDRVRILPSDRAVVVGSGMIGLLVIQSLRLAGCKEVFAVDVDPVRLELARELGATQTIDARRSDVVGDILELTGDRGVDIAMEVVGSDASIQTAIDCVRRGAQVGLVGNVSPEVRLPLQKVVARELTLLGSCASAGEYPRAIELVANGSIRVAPLISAVAPLADGPQWFERLYAREPGLMKVILKP
jgi:L-iditol 2-dehydrogenase